MTKGSAVYAFPERLKTLRGNRTQQELANEIGISRNTLVRYESGISKPDSEMLFRIAEYFQVSLDYLLGLNAPKTLDPKIKAICLSTGLSEKAVLRLKYGFGELTPLAESINFSEHDKYTGDPEKYSFSDKLLSQAVSALLESDDFCTSIMNLFYSSEAKAKVVKAWFPSTDPERDTTAIVRYEGDIHPQQLQGADPDRKLQSVILSSSKGGFKISIGSAENNAVIEINDALLRKPFYEQLQKAMDDILDSRQ